MTSERLTPLDRLLIAYAGFVAALILIRFRYVDGPAALLAAHAAIIAFILWLPARGSSWERRSPDEALPWSIVRILLRFLRYAYPLALVIFFFEEVAHFVNALWPENPYWFEPYLYAADRALFGELPAVLLNPYVSLPLTESMHFFYFSYYLVVLGGACYAFQGPNFRNAPPAKGFDTAINSVVAAFLCAYVFYPFFPARGPWENPELMASMTEFRGPLFTPIIKFIIANGAVSGGCIPSAHVAGTFSMAFGLLPHHRRVGYLALFLATGMAASCVYTRYHHAVDIAAGLACAAAGFWFARRHARPESIPHSRLGDEDH